MIPIMDDRLFTCQACGRPGENEAVQLRSPFVKGERSLKKSPSGLLLYAWRPEGYGPYSFFVMSESKAKAEEAVRQYIVDNNIDRYSVGGWPDSNLFTLDVVSENHVLINDNS